MSLELPQSEVDESQGKSTTQVFLPLMLLMFMLILYSMAHFLSLLYHESFLCSERIYFSFLFTNRRLTGDCRQTEEFLLFRCQLSSGGENRASFLQLAGKYSVKPPCREGVSQTLVYHCMNNCIVPSNNRQVLLASPAVCGPT